MTRHSQSQKRRQHLPFCFHELCSLENRQRRLYCSRGPTARLANRSEGVPMQWSWSQALQRVQMFRRAVAFVLRQPVPGINRIPLVHASITVSFRQDGRGGDGNARGVAVDQRFLLDQNI